MKNNFLRIAALLSLLAPFNEVLSFGLTTHAQISDKAIGISVLGNSTSTKARLGFVARPNEIGSFYYDFGPNLGNTVFARTVAEQYEGNIIVGANVLPGLGIEGWITRGVIREDDGGSILSFFTGTPTDDPYGNINRFCNHFLQPITRSAAIFAIQEGRVGRRNCPSSLSQNRT